MFIHRYSVTSNYIPGSCVPLITGNQVFVIKKNIYSYLKFYFISGTSFAFLLFAYLKFKFLNIKL